MPKAATQPVFGAATLHSMQAYELQCLDKPAERAVLAAAAPPGLLDAARAVWAKQALQASPSLCVLAILSWGLLFASCRKSFRPQVAKWLSNLVCNASAPQNWLMCTSWRGLVGQSRFVCSYFDHMCATQGTRSLCLCGAASARMLVAHLPF